MKLYEFGPTRSTRVRWILQELGVAFEAVSIDMAGRQHQSPGFLKLNPAGKLPVLVDGDLVLTESVAIVLYLAEKYPDRGFLPTDPRLRAEAYRWSLFAATELEQPVWRIAKHTAILPEEERIAADVALARRDFLPMAAVLERHMQGRAYLVGDSITAADFILAYTLDMASVTRLGLLEESPALRVYMERMYARPRAPLRIAEAFRALRSSAGT
jgi:glutathione S-transferase